MEDIEVVAKLDKKSLKDYLIFSFTHRRFFKFFVVIIAIAVLFIIANTVTAIVQQKVDFTTFLPYIVLVVMFLLYYLMFIFMINSSYKQNKKNSDVTVRYLFTPQYLFINDIKDDIYKGVRIKYNNFFSVYENKKYFYIFVDNKRSYILPKANIVKGNASLLREVLKKNVICVYNQHCK